MAADERRERDMVLAPNEYMFVLDQTKGHVDVFVGPNKQSLSGTDQPVTFDQSEKRFVDVPHSQAKQLVQTAPEGWYVVLKNPAPENAHPSGSGKQTASRLEVGKKVNIPGPVSFPLWPGQMAKVLKGHHLRSNQYLLGRVYDEEAARANWKQAVVKLAASAGTGQQPGSYSGTGQAPAAADAAVAAAGIAKASDLVMGQLLIIKGTEVSFFIPPTGAEMCSAIS